jgi:fatty-acyl-CoA synthase
MLGGMQDWPLRILRILDHAAREHGTRELVSLWADRSVTRTTWAGIAADSASWRRRWSGSASTPATGSPRLA